MSNKTSEIKFYVKHYGEKEPITPAQCRAARGLLNMDQATLAEAADVTRNVVIDFESGRRKTIKKNLAAITRVLEEAGVEFIPENGGGPGLRLKKE